MPEVETIKTGLQRLLPGRIIVDVAFDWDKSFPNAAADVETFLIGATIERVKRRAKVLLIELSTKYSLIIHLKMTGQLVFVGKAIGDATRKASSGFAGEHNIGASASNGAKRTAGTKKRVAQAANQKYAASQATQVTGSAELLGDATRWGGGHPNDSLIGNLPDKSTRVILTFKDGAHLYFNDFRKFGWMRLLPTAEVPNIDFFKKVGPEPLSKNTTAKEFITRIRRRANTSIKAALLDQTVIAGVGNIYADEALFAAKIHPATRVKLVSDKKLHTLLKELRAVLQLSIDKGGSSDKNYVNAEGKKGSYLSFAQVFRRQGQPCPRCGHIIEKIKVAGRGTHICPHEQRLPKEDND